MQQAGQGVGPREGNFGGGGAGHRRCSAQGRAGLEAPREPKLRVQGQGWGGVGQGKAQAAAAFRVKGQASTGPEKNLLR